MEALQMHDVFGRHPRLGMMWRRLVPRRSRGIMQASRILNIAKYALFETRGDLRLDLNKYLWVSSDFPPPSIFHFFPDFPASRFSAELSALQAVEVAMRSNAQGGTYDHKQVGIETRLRLDESGETTRNREQGRPERATFEALFFAKSRTRLSGGPKGRAVVDIDPAGGECLNRGWDGDGRPDHAKEKLGIRPRLREQAHPAAPRGVFFFRNAKKSIPRGTKARVWRLLDNRPNSAPTGRHLIGAIGNDCAVSLFALRVSRLLRPGPASLKQKKGGAQGSPNLTCW